MTKSISAARLEQLRRTAKRLVRTKAISHSEALDRIAAQHGFKNWSLLSKHSHSVPALAARPSSTPPPPEPKDERQRYYLHGDQDETDSTRYYCAECDVFFSADHFVDHGPHTGERLLERLEQEKKRDWRSKMNWRRPEDAVNLLYESALAARAQYQAFRPAFGEWLIAQGRRLRSGERRDSVAWMALGLLSNRGLPKTPKSLTQLKRHYQQWGKQYSELDVLEAAWEEFLAQHAERAQGLLDA